MARIHFKTKLVKDGGYTFIYFPSSLLGTRKRIRVKGTINRHPFATSAQAWRNEAHLITVNAEMRKRMGLVGGEDVQVELEPDPSPPPEIRIPPDFAKALRAKRGALAAFKAMAWSHRKEYVEAIEEAKKPETRARRIQQAIEMIAAKTDPFHPKERKRK